MPRIETMLAAMSTEAMITAAMLIFMVVFVLIAVWVMFGRSSYFHSAARIPMSDHDVVEPNTNRQSTRDGEPGQ